MEYQNIWNSALSLLENEYTQVSFDTMIRPLAPISLKDGVLVLKAPQKFIKDTVEHRYSKTIENKLLAVSGDMLKVEIVSDDDQKSPPRQIYETSINLNSKFVFDAFVKGASNELAYEASVAVADNPGQTLYNPLFMYGKVGLGKTHLMHSIGNHAFGKDPSRKVLYTSTENFTNEFIYSLRKNRMQEFRDKFRNVDIFLIDDIQFLSEKESTQEELFHTFNTLYNANKQIVISSDLPPKDLKSIEDRLTSRFGNGLIVDITLPDYETRMAILEKKAELENMVVSKDITEFIARNIISNIRDLEGAIIKIIAMSKLNKTDITYDMADRVLKEFLRGNEKREVTVRLIQETVASHFNISLDEMLSKSRIKKLTHPRHIAMYLCRKMLVNLSTVKIGEFFGKDHSTIINGADNIAVEIEHSRELNETVIALEKRIKDG